jgi:N-acyl-D-aspartate/D-glutamate deacylase
MGSLLGTLRSTPLGQNVAALLAHGALRVSVMGFEQRVATEQEILTQEALVTEAMQAGAAGMSLGLAYVPGTFTPTDELVRLARIVGRHGGVLAAHMREEGDNCLTAIQEMLDIAEQAEVPVHLSHLKLTGKKNWGSIDRALDLITDARARDIDVTVDMYPYNAGSTTITQLLPSWAMEGGVARMLERLDDAGQLQRIHQDVQRQEIDWSAIRLAAFQQEQHKALEGLSILQASEQSGQAPEDTLFQLIRAEKGQIPVIMFTMDQRDVDLVAQAPFAMVGSDGLPILSGRPHPRLYGTFPRFIARYVRDLRTIELEQAIARLSAFPSKRFRLADRGTIALNAIADLVIFNPESIQDQATYHDPQVYPVGISAVIVAGQAVVLDDKVLSNHPGQFIAAIE